MGGGHLGRSDPPRGREDAADQDAVRPRGRGALLARARRQLPEAHAQGLRLAQHRCAIFCAVPWPARRGVQPHVRRGRRLAGTNGHPQRPLPGTGGLTSRREHAQHAGAGVRRGHRGGRLGHRRGPTLLGGREQGEVLLADQARHRPCAHPRLDERHRARRALRQALRRVAWVRLRSVRSGNRLVHAGMGVSRDRDRRRN